MVINMDEVNEVEEENIRLKTALHMIFERIQEGAALSDIQRLPASLANILEWPYSEDPQAIEPVKEEEE